MSPSFAFRETWEVAAPPHAVHEVLVDLEHYPDWWRQVVAVASLGPDDARVLCRSTLPYVLDLRLHAVDRSPGRLEVRVSGDLHGTVRFDLAATGGGTRLDFEQEVDVRGWLAAMARPAAPVMRWNHHRMMRGCRDGLSDRLS